VPLIIAGPGFGKNKRFKSCVDQLDLQATLFDIFNVRKPTERKGRSLLNRKDDYENTIIFSEYQGHGVRGSSFMVRKGDFKYIWYYDAPSQLFNLKEDPDELKNLVSQIPDKVYEMDSHLREFCDPEKEQLRTEQFIQKQLKVGLEMKKAQEEKTA
jgi:choline-sulfatase